MATYGPMTDTAVIILAAGNGSRMKSDLPKVLHPIVGLPIINHVVRTARNLTATEIVVVLGENADAVAKAVAPCQTVVQTPPRGTGDAVKQAYQKLSGFKGTILVLYGDVPLISQKILSALIAQRESTNATLVVLGFRSMSPGSYGRIIAQDDKIEKIVEARDATAEELDLNLCNSGIMAFDGQRLGALLDMLQNDNAQEEYYLTDCVAHARSQNWLCQLVITPESEVVGINTRHDQAIAEQIAQNRLRKHHLMQGVTMLDPDSIYFCHDTKIGENVVLEPNIFFGAAVSIGDNVHIRTHCHIEGATIEEGARVGPFARLRPGTTIGKLAKIGNFVETKNADIGEGVAISHLSYIGDATIGAFTNIGAGAITCNYDGFSKHQTAIGANVFVGSNASLIAPVKIGDGAIVGAGSVITKNIAEDALGLTRSKQEEHAGYATTRKQKKVS